MPSKIAKHDDASGFDFVNDTGAVIAAGDRVTLGGLIGIATSPIEKLQAGHAEFLTGPTTVWRLYPAASLAAAIAVGDPVTDPDDGEMLGTAVYGDVGRKPAGLNAAPNAAEIGDDVVYFVGGPKSPSAGATESITVISTNAASIETDVVALAGTGTIVECAFNFNETVNLDSGVLANLLANGETAAAPEGYILKFANVDAINVGKFQKTADGSSTVMEFNSDEFLTLIKVGAGWKWL